MDDRYWFKNAIFYEVYVRAFYDSNNDGHGDIQGLIKKLDYLKDLGIDCIWLLPINRSPLCDDGYDVADYYQILPEYGILADVKQLFDEVHRRNMRIIMDLVINHTSDKHPWFQAARKDPGSVYRDYYVWSDTDTKYAQARVIFIDTEKSNWAWDDVAKKYYWHRFYSNQPDLNYDNPSVRAEMLNVMKYWLDMGVDGFRVDAAPYLYEREGTNCENLPETHAYLKEMREFVDKFYPGKVLLCEANQWPDDVRQYFGDGDEFHMGFHFPLMPRIFMALKKGSREPVDWVMAQTPNIPESCQWCTFLRNHDELTLEMVSEQERQWMWQMYAPEPRMRLNLGIRRRLAPLLDNDKRKILLAFSLLLTLTGSPVLYYGDEIGMGDNIWLPDRNGVRMPMQWEPGECAGFSGANHNQLYAPIIDDTIFSPNSVNVADQLMDSSSLFKEIKHLITLRKQNELLSKGRYKPIGEENRTVLSYLREYQDDHILIINNLGGNAMHYRLPVDLRCIQYQDLITVTNYHGASVNELCVDLKPYQFLWLKVM